MKTVYLIVIYAMVSNHYNYSKHNMYMESKKITSMPFALSLRTKKFLRLFVGKQNHIPSVENEMRNLQILCHLIVHLSETFL